MFKTSHHTQHLLLLLLIHHLQVSKASTFIYKGCSTTTSTTSSDPTSSFHTNLNSLLSSMANSASQSSYNTFSSNSSSSSSPLFGLYQCRGDLSNPDCFNCISSAIAQLALLCSPDALGATIQLDGCYLRYESDPSFIGTLDTTLVYKKCSESLSSDGDFFRRRDDVLGDLENGVGFRVSSSGSVEGFAQCLGDLRADDCGKCLAEAVGKLKNACGAAVAADVFLAQCYASYWAAGYYPLSSSAKGARDDDDIGRTVAIIVGALAGVAVVVVFLSFLRKAMSY
ncbi:Cysteine-rich repeat secretory protein 15 [Acorus calamus]|uniref:Cysteine-rich repeat secretory protein 15 n=1 Tax=Acorus calamus TaxID=4465 RepID=A0AAV9FK04_ACOCL|nr:Cysteine-rich repeat secretory protein 15 [Acorus calamus]